MPGTARDVARTLGMSYQPASLTSDTNYNIQLGSSYFQRRLDQNGNHVLALAAYNAGQGNMNKWLASNGDPRSGNVDMLNWIEDIPFFETKNYVQRVVENAVVYDLMNPTRAKSRGPYHVSWYLGRRPPR
jgi:soluble lytic murein transglycosylase